MFKQYKLKNYRFRLIAYVVILCIIGVMVVGSAKPSVQNKQIVGLIGGLAINIHDIPLNSGDEKVFLYIIIQY